METFVGNETATHCGNAHNPPPAVGSDPEPYRLDYALTTGSGYLTTLLTVRAAADGWKRSLELRRSEGRWEVSTERTGDSDLPDPGGDLTKLHHALDPDLGLSPLFNTMPVLRHGIHNAGHAEDFLMVWISVPDLSLHPSPQRYTHVGSEHGIRTVRFEAAGDGEDFTADLQFDSDGFVVDYPGIATRLRPHSARTRR